MAHIFAAILFTDLSIPFTVLSNEVHAEVFQTIMISEKWIAQVDAILVNIMAKKSTFIFLKVSNFFLFLDQNKKNFAFCNIKKYATTRLPYNRKGQMISLICTRDISTALIAF